MNGQLRTENRELRTNYVAVVALLLVSALALAAESGRAPTRAQIAERVKALSSTDPIKVAGAAYWLGEQGSAAVEAISPLAGVLGDSRPVDPAQYRKNLAGRASSTSPGHEAAAALAKIGDPAIQALINILKTSPNPYARQNAAWALGIIQDRHAAGNTGSLGD